MMRRAAHERLCANSALRVDRLTWSIGVGAADRAPPLLCHGAVAWRSRRHRAVRRDSVQTLPYLLWRAWAFSFYGDAAGRRCCSARLPHALIAQRHWLGRGRTGIPDGAAASRSAQYTVSRYLARRRSFSTSISPRRNHRHHGASGSVIDVTPRWPATRRAVGPC